jgi:hypothetical protein
VRRSGYSPRNYRRPAGDLDALIARTRTAPDAIALALLTTGLLLTRLDVIRGAVPVSLDSATQFLPWYSLIGERLRTGELPGWNPYTFAGAPLAADPSSGWMYLPTMFLFAAFPLGIAAQLYLLMHPLLAGLTTYLLGRNLRLAPLAALTAASAYAFSGFVQVNSVCCFQFAGVACWLPLAVLGVEMAVQRGDAVGRLSGWSLAGLALSQILAIWPGQGAYYAFLLVSCYGSYRGAILAGRSRSPRHVRWRRRIGGILLHGGLPLVLGLGLGAAGLLPRLEFNSLSNLAGGYPTDALYVGGWAIRDWDQLILPGFWHAGALVLLLASAAPFVTRGRPWRSIVLFFGVMCPALLSLTTTQWTPLSAVLSGLLPEFARLHPHAPERILIVFYLGVALLAGFAADGIGHRLAWRCGWRRLMLIAFPVLIAIEGAGAGMLALNGRGQDDPLDSLNRIEWVDLASYYAPSGAARFLQERAATDGPFRFLGYQPVDLQGSAPYTMRWADPSTVAVQANNRAIRLGLYDIQGYDAVHVARYDDLFVAINGKPQNYHDAQVYKEGLFSPILDLLNVRYIVVPSTWDSHDELRELQRIHPTVYHDESVAVLENTSALPRAWLVHEVAQVSQGDAPDLLAGGQVDPRRTGLLEEPPPAGLNTGSELDNASSVQMVALQSDRIEVQTSDIQPGLLVLSDVYYPAWRAYIDDMPARILPVDHVLRGVPLPPGEHRVDIRFESTALWIGLLISLATSSGIIAALGAFRICSRAGPSLGGLGRRSAP